MGKLKPGAEIIYESPDDGSTIYGRYAWTNERWIVGYSQEKQSTIDQIREAKLWGEIRQAAKTNRSLQKALDRVITIYRLSKDDPL